VNKSELGRKIYDVAHLTGRDFTLSSGIISNEYFDKYQFESNPFLLGEIAEQMQLLLPIETEVLAGLDMGGIALSTALSLRTGLPQVQVRKEAKKYGTMKLAEGIDIAGKNLTIIEDIITTGRQIILSASELRELGANIEYALGVIGRNPQGKLNLQKNGIELITLFTARDLSSY
jgi:orotate phosphoribosyltransferase